MYYVSSIPLLDQFGKEMHKPRNQKLTLESSAGSVGATEVTFLPGMNSGAVAFKFVNSLKATSRRIFGNVCHVGKKLLFLKHV